MRAEMSASARAAPRVLTAASRGVRDLMLLLETSYAASGVRSRPRIFKPTSGFVLRGVRMFEGQESERAGEAASGKRAACVRVAVRLEFLGGSRGVGIGRNCTACSRPTAHWAFRNWAVQPANTNGQPTLAPGSGGHRHRVRARDEHFCIVQCRSYTDHSAAVSTLS